MKDSNKIFKKILREYFQLSILNPIDDLLEYFILDERGFRLSDDKMKRVKFFCNFKKDLPTFDEFMGGREDTLIDILKYGHRVKCSLLQNYHDALEEKVKLYYKVIMN
jgi:hypothetical protein